MATAPMVPQTAPYQQHGYKNSGNFQAMTRSGGNSPLNSSPTSPRSTSHLPQYPNYPNQIRPPKPPIYVPAALRRTERPQRQSPPKVDSVMDPSEGGPWPGTTFPQSAGGDGAASPFPRIANEDLHSIHGDTPLSPVSGPITKNHWQPDSSTSVCTASSCQTPFSMFVRKHHCRKCGGIFCWQHSQQRVKLNESALFHPDGDLQRACDRCHFQFREWEQARSSRANSESSGSTTAVRIDTPAAAKRPDNHRVGSLASSFQGAWNWSTF